MSASPIVSLLGDTLRCPDGSTVSTSSACDGKTAIGLYFSAHWCPPCRGFTPTLGKKYQELLAAGKSFELVFVSSDRDNEAFTEYANSMPFKALPFADRTRKNDLSTKFKVSGIPTLVFIDGTTGKVINKNARGAISRSTFVEDFPFIPAATSDLSEDCSGINETPALVIMMDTASPEDQKNLSSQLGALAESERKAANPRVGMFLTAKGEGPINQIKQATGMKVQITPHAHPLTEVTDNNPRWGCDGCGKPGQNAQGRFQCKDCDFDYCDECHAKANDGGPVDPKPQMIILDLDDEGAFYLPAENQSEVTPENMEAFVSAFAAKTLTRKQWGQA
jgi:thiol-disulfide isomerase/thioredoxin